MNNARNTLGVARTREVLAKRRVVGALKLDYGYQKYLQRSLGR